MLSVSPVAVGFLDRELRYTRLTAALAALHGVSVDEAGGRHLVCCFFPVAIANESVGVGAILLDDTERRRLDAVARMRTLELEAVLASIPEGVYVGDSGGVRTASRRALEMLGFELVIQSSAAPLRTNEGIVGAVAVNIDVTPQRKIERELRMQRELVMVERDVLMLLGEGAPLENVLATLAHGLERVCGQGLLASVLMIEDAKVRHIAAPSLLAAFCAAIEGLLVAADLRH